MDDDDEQMELLINTRQQVLAAEFFPAGQIHPLTQLSSMIIQYNYDAKFELN